MNTELELELWGSAWRAPAAAPIAPAWDFRTEHRRQEWRLRAHYIFGICFAVMLTCYAVVVLRHDFRPEVLAWAVVVWITTAGATAFSVWNWRGLWNQSACSVLAYADAYEKRSLAMLRAMRVGYWFLVLQLSIAAPWLSWDFVRHEMTALRYALGMASLAGLTVWFVAWSTVSRRRALLELMRVKEFRLNVSNGNSDVIQTAVHRRWV